jgi:hypothetical protein
MAPPFAKKLAVGVNGQEEPPSPPSHMHLWGFARPRPWSDSGGVLVSGLLAAFKRAASAKLARHHHPQQGRIPRLG